MHGTPSIRETDSEVREKGTRTEGGETHQQVADGAEATAYLTTNHGTKISDDQNSLRLGARGPTLRDRPG